MNVFAIESCGKITNQDDYAVFMQGVSLEHAKQVMALLCDATGDTVRARFVGMDRDGSLIPPEYSTWELTPEQRKAELDALREEHKDAS